MSSTGIGPINSGPLAIRTYLNSTINNTYILGKYDIAIPPNRVLTTSTNGLLAPSNQVSISSINVSSISAINSTITFNNEVIINPNTTGPSLFVSGSTIFTEPGAPDTPTNANVTIWGLPSGDPIQQTFTTSHTYTINSTISKINFQLIGSGGASTFSNPIISNQDQPGYGTYIAGTLAVKQGDLLHITIGQIGSNLSGSSGTSLVYISTTGSGSYISTLVAIAGAGGGNGYALVPISSSSGGGHGGGGNGLLSNITSSDYIVPGTLGYDGINIVNEVYVSDTDGGQGGQIQLGGTGGNGNPANVPNNGSSGNNPDVTNLLITGGIVSGGQGGNGGYTGGWGGAGYSGGGGGGASALTSAGGGGGATYIATSTLSQYLSNVVCLGGQFLANNSAIPFGGDYGLPNNSGFCAISAYSPNDTLYTNGDIQCRVLRYEMLDPPINAIGGASALWALYPAIDIVTMNDNQIVECGGIEVSSGGIDVTGDAIFRDQVSTLSDLSVGGDLTVNGIINHPSISPTGSIVIYAGVTDPNGWLICNGRTLNRTGLYGTLFNVIGTTFGSGDGLTTFNIPDMRNRFTVGVGSDYSLGDTGGTSSTILTQDQLPAHSHTVNDPGHLHGTKGYWNVGSASGSSKQAVADGDSSDYPAPGNTNTMYSASTNITISTTGMNAPIENRPPYIAINYIIKY